MPPTILAADDRSLARAAGVLRLGGVVAFPTETVYGLGAHALLPQAVVRVFEAKARPTFDPLIVHTATAESAKRLAADWPDAAARLAEALWPGPLTLVVPRCPDVPDLVTAGLPNVGLRVPRHPVAQRLLTLAAVPVAAPSANRFGAISPTRAEHVAAEFDTPERGSELVDLVLDGGPCATGIESTVVCVAGDRPRVLRLGGVTIETIENIVGPVAVDLRGSDPSAGLAAPGMLDRHYAPRTPLRLIRSDDWTAAGERVAYLWFDRPRVDGDSPAAVLSERGDLAEAAANLFVAMRRLDGAGVDAILAEPVPDVGLGRAINDRLRRAATR
jgi:L-threonylcarbamoyladenylate synthase